MVVYQWSCTTGRSWPEKSRPRILGREETQEEAEVQVHGLPEGGHGGRGHGGPKRHQKATTAGAMPSGASSRRRRSCKASRAPAWPCAVGTASSTSWARPRRPCKTRLHVLVQTFLNLAQTLLGKSGERFS